MFSFDRNENTQQYSNEYERIILGAGALGLFLAHRILTEFTEPNLNIISKSPQKLPIFVENPKNELQEMTIPNYYLSEKLDQTFPKLNKGNVIIYICLPPEKIQKAFEYIKKIVQKSENTKTIFMTFLNNGIINYNFFTYLQLFFKDKISFYLIRGIVISGFIRETHPDKLVIKNTSGKEIYYGFYNSNNLQLTHNILPNQYLTWNYSDEIFFIEKAKFLINFVLGLYIKNRLLINSDIYSLISKKDLNLIFKNYCKLFPDKSITETFIENYFKITISNASSNINSISYAWYHGNKKPIDYFVAKIKEMSYSLNNKKVQDFFVNLINLNYIDLK